MKSSTRRRLLVTPLGGPLAAASSAQAPTAAGKVTKEVHHRNGKKPEEPPLYNSAISLGDLVFLSGTGVNKPSDVAGQTVRVLESIERRLIQAGSSMQQVLRCIVFLKDLDDFAEMNQVFRGRFGGEPPVRATVAVAGIPLKGCRVEIEVIAYR